MIYTVHVEPDELDGGFIAWVEELPGVMSQGETWLAALRNVAFAAEEAAEGVRAHEPKDM